MTRTRRLKLGYLALLLALLGAVVVLALTVDSAPALVVLVLLTLLPGRVQGYFYREFFRGRYLFSEGRPEEAILRFERFLEAVRARPWIKRLVWLQFAVYTTDIEAMTLNNLGAAHLALEDTEAAERFLRDALRIDPRYPMALYNLSLTAAMRGEEAEAERLLAEAKSLGFSRGGVDALLQRGGERLARWEGRGAG